MLFGIFLALITGLALWSLWLERNRISGWRWLGLGLCRLAGIAILATAFWDFRLPGVVAGSGRPLALAIVDASLSMARRDGDTVSRYHRALTDAELFMQRRRDLMVRIVSPGERSLEAPGENPKLPETDIAAWIHLAAAQQPDAIVLFSDGNNNTGQEPVAVAAATGLPILTLGYGPTDDCLPYIAEVWAEEQVNIGEEVSINYRLSDVADTLILEAQAETKRLARQRIPPRTQNWGCFKYRPTTAGIHRIKLYLQQGGDTLDERTVVIRAEKQRLRVAIWCGRPDWNLRFLQKALLSDPDIGLDVYLKRQGRWERVVDGKPFHPDSARSHPWEVALLLNFRPEDLDPELERFIIGMVSRGEMSVWFIGRCWDWSFRSREIYKLWPLRIGSGQLIRARLRLDGLHEKMLSLSTERSPKSERERRPMPPLSIPRDCRQASGEVNVVAQAEDGAQPIPCWAWWYQGRSRVFQSTAEDLWIWELSNTELNREPEEISFYSRSIRSLVKWLAGFRDWQTVVGPQRPFFYRGQEVVLRGLIPIAMEEGREDIIWQATIEDTRGNRWRSRLIPWGRGQYQSVIEGLPPGDYRWRTELISRGRVVDRSQGVFFVEPGRAEDRGRAQQVSLLKDMAAVSQGRYWNRQGMSGDLRWMSEIEVRPRVKGEEGLPAIPILAASVLLMAELFWRRRWGLK